MLQSDANGSLSSPAPLCTPFKPHLLADNISGAITALAVGVDTSDPSKCQVYVGTSNGNVFRFSCTSAGAQGETKTAASQVSVGKQEVGGLCVLAEVQRVAVLVGGQVLLLDHLTLDRAAHLSIARGAYRFTQQVASRRTRGCRLVVALPQKLLVLEIRQTERKGVAAAVVKDLAGLDSVQTLVWMGDSLIVGTRSEYVLISLKQQTALPLGNFSSSPLLALFPARLETLLLVDQLGIFVNSRGEAVGVPLEFQSKPHSLAVSSPYVLSGTTRVEVYNSQSGALLQILPFSTTTPLLLADGAGGKILLAATHSQVWWLNRIPEETQARQLLQEGHHALALAVAAQSSPGELPPHVAARVAAAEAQTGLLLLQELRWEEAMSALTRTTAMQPTELFPLFPTWTQRWRSLVPRKRYWGLHAPLQSLPQTIRHHFPSPLPEEEVQRQTQVAMHAIARYLCAVRGRGVSEVESEGVETLLVHLYAHLGDTEKLLALAQGTCHCLLEEVEDDLAATDQRPALALLLERRGQSERAVQQWMVVADQGEEGRAVEEVSRLLPAVTDTPQLLEHLKWLVGRAPERALKVLCMTRTPPLPLDFVFPLLSTSPPHLQRQYLRWLLLDQGWEEEAEHTRYALLLVRASNGPDADSIREELQSFLHKSSFYDPAGVLAEIQEKAPHLLAEQALLLGREGRHKAALRILALEVGDSEAAEQYCLDLNSPSALMDLLDVYLHPGCGRPPLYEPTARLLHCQGGMLDPMALMETLPGEMELGQAVTSLTRMLGEFMHSKRQNQIVHQLSRKQNLAARFARVEQRSRHVAVNKATACAECGSRIGLKLCGLHPSGNLMCYQCLEEQSQLI